MALLESLQDCQPPISKSGKYCWRGFQTLLGPLFCFKQKCLSDHLNSRPRKPSEGRLSESGCRCTLTKQAQVCNNRGRRSLLSKMSSCHETQLTTKLKNKNAFSIICDEAGYLFLSSLSDKHRHRCDATRGETFSREITNLSFVHVVFSHIRLPPSLSLDSLLSYCNNIQQNYRFLRRGGCGQYCWKHPG